MDKSICVSGGKREAEPIKSSSSSSHVHVQGNPGNLFPAGFIQFQFPAVVVRVRDIHIIPKTPFSHQLLQQDHDHDHDRDRNFGIRMDGWKTEIFLEHCR